MFSGDNKNSKESIFEIQFSMSSANGATYRTQFHRWIGVSELSLIHIFIDMNTIWNMPAVNVSFILPFICFVVITIYGHRSYQRGKY